MYNFIIRLIACFIPDKESRRRFRRNHRRPGIVDKMNALDKRIGVLDDKINEFGQNQNKIIQSLDDISRRTDETIGMLKRLDDISYRTNEGLGALNRINDLSHELQHVKNILLNTTDITAVPPAHGIMRQVQMLNLDVLSAVDKVCRKHNLSYWLDFGTLLGAVRHRGFVPWDDDIDIGMPAADYEKFCKIADQELKDTCAFFKRVPSQIGKTLHRDFVPQTPSEWADFIFWRLRGKLAFATDIFPYYFSDMDTDVISDTLRQGCSVKDKLFENFNNYDEFTNVENQVLPLQNKIASETGRYLFLGLETRVYQPHIYKSSDVFPLKELEFEGKKFFVPNNYNKILIDTYGDFFEFPHDMHRHLFLRDLNPEELDKLNRLNNE